METKDKEVSTSPAPANIRIKKCESCGAEKKEKFLPEVKQYMEFMKRELVVQSARWEWADPKDGLSDQYGKPMCRDCVEKERMRRREVEIEKKQKEYLDEKINMIGGALNFKNFTFEKYNPLTASQCEAFKACKEFNRIFHNLFLIGEAGVGKTHLATATLNEHYRQGSKRYRITELLRHFRIKRDAEAEQKLIDEFVDCPILVIEDFGVQKSTDWSIQIWWEILDRRIEAGRNGLIVTSNTGRSKLAESMGDKITSRMSGLCRVIKIEGLDLRVNPKPT